MLANLGQYMVAVLSRSVHDGRSSQYILSDLGQYLLEDLGQYMMADLVSTCSQI